MDRQDWPPQGENHGSQYSRDRNRHHHLDECAKAAQPIDHAFGLDRIGAPCASAGAASMPAAASQAANASRTLMGVSDPSV